MGVQGIKRLENEIKVNLHGEASAAMVWSPLADALDRKTRGKLHSSAEVSGEVAVTSAMAWEPSLIGGPDTGSLFCQLCARDASYGTVFKSGHAYCSVECADSVAGLYLG